ncbi:MAG TPA: hypothetical protein VEU54_04915 [Steroidobacteraceae bacterium]|jgi:hypothetical protein|nr:hypothetical protein [Steroidobacteraceae bacterium]
MFKSLAIGMSLALALAACASTPPAPAKTTAKAVPLGCVASTATRIPVKDGQCAGFGSVYTQEDLNRTGQVLPGSALRMLDPALTVTGH